MADEVTGVRQVAAGPPGQSLGRREYADAIYIAKGIAIILIVIGHFQPTLSPPYWQDLRDIVYTFHIQVFLFLSGFLFAGDKVITSLPQYRDFIRKKARRLLVPFISVAAIIFALKIVGGRFDDLIYPVNLTTCMNLVLNPIESFAPTLWFLYVLFEIFVVVGLGYCLIGNENIILILSILLFFLPWVFIFMIGPLFYYLPVFLIGYIFYRHNIINKNKYSLGIITILLFISLLLFRDVIFLDGIPRRIYRLILGLSGAISCFFISMQIARLQHGVANLLKLIGFYSLVIYLVHPPFMGIVRVMLLNAIPSMAHGFIPLALAVILCGLFLPMGLEKYVLRRYKWAGNLILGPQ